MQNNPQDEIFTIGIGGAAGDGVMEAGTNLGLLLRDLGYNVYLSTDYPSLIRGGHNFTRLSFGRQKIWSDYRGLDVLVALDGKTVGLRSGEMNENSVVFADDASVADAEVAESLKKAKCEMVSLPMLRSATEIGATAITRNSVALGALCYLLDLPLEKMTEILRLIFAEKRMQANVRLAEIGYEYLQKLNFRHSKKIDVGENGQLNVGTSTTAGAPQHRHGDAEFLDGNTAFAKGLQAAGCDFYFAYPMTPSSGILHYLAREQKVAGLKVIQPENEIAVINMALGAIYAGKRAAIGSATGGFALMQEALSFAGMAELPLSIAVSQRQAPATGSPTHSSQSDLRFVLSGGHGEFPRIVIAPGDLEECFRAGELSLNLAWKFQIPVIVLLDKIISEHSMTGHPDYDSVSVDKGKLAENPGEDYKRYTFTDDGVSPMAFPGVSNATVKVTSYEHDEDGISADAPEDVKKMLDKRFAKIKGIKENMLGRETIKVYGDSKSENAIVFFGSTKSAVLEASKHFAKPAKILQIIWMEPFPIEMVVKELSGAKKIICVEGNHNAQLAGLIREKTGIEVTDKILKYDSMPFDVIELADQVNKIFNF
jgi:2-oxoglutarate ferredoxin oxidoreductase subunit alpha